MSRVTLPGAGEMSLKDVLYIHAETAGFQPAIDIFETRDSLIVEIDLPGINPDDVLIKVLEDILIIEGVKREHSRERVLNYICMERKFAGFRRMLQLPALVDAGAGKASYAEGVVTVRFPKLTEKVIKIKIET